LKTPKYKNTAKSITSMSTGKKRKLNARGNADKGIEKSLNEGGKVIILIGEEKDRNAIWVVKLQQYLAQYLSLSDALQHLSLSVLSVETLKINVVSNKVENWCYVINRVPESSQSNIAKTATAILQYCTLLNINVYNSYECYLIGQNKLLHHGILSALSLRSPPSILVRNFDAIKNAFDHQNDNAVQTSVKLKFPVLLKPNSGGYGRGIFKFQTKDEILDFCDKNKDGGMEKTLFGNDGTALLQQYYNSVAGSTVYRVWTLNGQIQCGIKVERPKGGFGGACLSDTCSRTQTMVEAIDIDNNLSKKLQYDILRIEKLCKANCCSVEYLFEADDLGNLQLEDPIFFDVNMLSTLPTNLGVQNKIKNANKVWGEAWNHWKLLAMDIFNNILKHL